MSFFKAVYTKLETLFEIIAEARMKSIEARKSMWY
jgi:hypothetical protein